MTDKAKAVMAKGLNSRSSCIGPNVVPACEEIPIFYLHELRVMDIMKGGGYVAASGRLSLSGLKVSWKFSNTFKQESYIKILRSWIFVCIDNVYRAPNRLGTTMNHEHIRIEWFPVWLMRWFELMFQKPLEPWDELKRIVHEHFKNVREPLANISFPCEQIVW